MNLRETIKNIRATCNNYMDPDLFAFIIDEEFYMGTNNIMEINGYDINDDDTYEDKLLKINKKENIFLPVGMMTFMPILNECDIFSHKDYNLKLSAEEFNKYADEEEKLFGILIKKENEKYIIGKTDVCNCSVDASFKKIEKSEDAFYKKIEEIINEKIV